MLAAIPQEATMSSGQDSSHLFLIVEDMGMQSKLVIQANWAMGTRGLWEVSDTCVLSTGEITLCLFFSVSRAYNTNLGDYLGLGS